MSAKFPEADHKSYMLRLKRHLHEGKAIVYGRNRARITLEKKFKDKALKRMEKGLPLKQVLSSEAMVNKVKRAIKKKKPAKKPKAKKPKKSDASKKGKNSKDGAKRQSAKDRQKQKAKENKKTEGSRETKKKVDQKRKKEDKKVDRATKKNTN